MPVTERSTVPHNIRWPCTKNFANTESCIPLLRKSFSSSLGVSSNTRAISCILYTVIATVSLTQVGSEAGCSSKRDRNAEVRFLGVETELLMFAVGDDGVILAYLPPTFLGDSFVTLQGHGKLQHTGVNIYTGCFKTAKLLESISKL